MTATTNGKAVARAGEARRFTVTTPDGLQLSAQSWGNPAGPAILFIHGFGQCHLSWLPQMRSRLAQDFHLITYDLRGHGESDKPLAAERYSANRVWADDVVAVLDAAGAERAVLVGWSFGGRAAMDALQAYGEGRFAGLNLVGSKVLAVTDPQAAASLPLRPLMGSDDLSVSIPAVRQFLRLCFATMPDDDTLQEILAFNMLVPPAVRRVLHGRPFQPGAFLRGLRLPTLVTIGDRDALTPMDHAREVVSLIPGAQLSVYDGVGHSPFYEAADRFNGELHDFTTRAFAEHRA
ncbi:alpha/beta fold hydrolase [Acidisphaera sp. L21]|uniref:alpha/beta fold hydrolase n=1 Tax=Acidisphaera sp. L21 TaxID=1641851 RepID=UPI00131C3721|nr:alpha/beta hydrolase [Acidisphaera sp. L21]